MRKINYDIGYCYLIDAKPFEYKNFIVYNMGIDILFKVIKDKKPFYFTAEAEDGKTDLLPDRALFDDFYASHFINISIDPFLDPEWGVIWVDFNSEAGKAFARNFSYIGIFEQFYLNGTFLPADDVMVAVDLPVTIEEFKKIAIEHGVCGYGEPVGYYTKEWN